MENNLSDKNENKEKKGRGVSHSKIILMGEHSVVYGYPAIAIPLKNIRMECIVERATVPFIHNKKDTLSTAIYTALNYLNKENENIKYKVVSDIPPKRGMGSSAAVSIAAIRGVLDYFNTEVDNLTLEKLVNEAEIIAHNTPSGLDAKTCLSDSAIKFIKNKGFKNLEMNLGAYLLIADTGIHGHTRDAIMNIKNMGDRALPMLEKLGKLTEETEKFIEEKDVINIGKNMISAHGELKKLGVSIKKSDVLVKTAIDEGAYGAKMSGGGLGGCIIALMESREKAEMTGKKLMEKGAVNIWIEAL
jgi:mevalonate kinase